MTREEFLQATGKEIIENADYYGKLHGIVFADIDVDGELVRIEAKCDFSDVAEYAKAKFLIEPESYIEIMQGYQDYNEVVYAYYLDQVDKAEVLRIHEENAKFDDDLFSFCEDELPEDEVYIPASLEEMRSEAIGKVWESCFHSLNRAMKSIEEELRFEMANGKSEEAEVYKNIYEMMQRRCARAEQKIKEEVTSFINAF